MVRILSIFITTLAAVSPVAHAGVCVPGLQYCGSTLKDYGKEPAQAGPLVEIDKDRDAITEPRACMGILYTSAIPMEV
ncbi:hypothetical protein E4U51_001556 [Claviceps purpurea]|nr:hypothetical protein E4U51_001556 [Claviceps purpurea]